MTFAVGSNCPPDNSKLCWEHDLPDIEGQLVGYEETGSIPVSEFLVQTLGFQPRHHPNPSSEEEGLTLLLVLTSKLSFCISRPMTKDEFELLFGELLSQPLIDAGFERDGKSLIFDDGLRTIALIRLGGRKARPGAIVQLLGFRHSFLRTLVDMEVPPKPPLDFNDYPFGYAPSELFDVNPNDFVYPSDQRREPDVQHWSGEPFTAVSSYLNRTARLILDKFLPWTDRMEPTLAAQQISELGNDVWCEKLWLEDYRAYLEEA